MSSSQFTVSTVFNGLSHLPKNLPSASSPKSSVIIAALNCLQCSWLAQDTAGVQIAIILWQTWIRWSKSKFLGVHHANNPTLCAHESPPLLPDRGNNKGRLKHGCVEHKHLQLVWGWSNIVPYALGPTTVSLPEHVATQWVPSKHLFQSMPLWPKHPDGSKQCNFSFAVGLFLHRLPWRVPWGFQ